MTPTERGSLVTFEGIDGCGKTTQINLTCKLLEKCGYQVKMLREPGSTKTAERIRKIVLDRRLTVHPTTELLLYEAARAELTEAEIAPLLKRGVTVLCDRFYDSTTAYQGYGRRLDIKTVRFLHKVAVGEIVPGLTILLDVDLKTAAARRRGNPDRLELQSAAFFNRVRRGFLEIARKERRRVKVVDATQPIEDVFRDVRKYLARKFDLK